MPTCIPCLEHCYIAAHHTPAACRRKWMALRADSLLASSQWETALRCNDVSHWLGANIKSAIARDEIRHIVVTACHLGDSRFGIIVNILNIYFDILSIPAWQSFPRTKYRQHFSLLSNTVLSKMPKRFQCNTNLAITAACCLARYFSRVIHGRSIMNNRNVLWQHLRSIWPTARSICNKLGWFKMFSFMQYKSWQLWINVGRKLPSDDDMTLG